MKLLYISHAHPKFSKGGAETASWNLFQAMQKEGHECTYMGRVGHKSHGGSFFSSLAPNDILLHSTLTDNFLLSNSQPDLFREIAELVTRLKPDIIHLHHYLNIGVEVFPILKRAAPNAKLILTLHEMAAICSHNGQMVTNPELTLCRDAHPLSCADCFPKRTSSDFFLRKTFIQNHFSFIDQFISPSHFLASRYEEWGLPADKISVAENSIPPHDSLESRNIPVSSPSKKGNEKPLRGRLAFFGQINPYKGLDILLRAMDLLPETTRDQVELFINGANLENQTKVFKENIDGLLEKNGHRISMLGSYEPHELRKRMAQCDWVIIPSIWWENSPMVIQEAISLGRPIIGADIGGMKEKVDGIAGLCFEARNPLSLAEKIQEAIQPEVYEKWRKKLNPADGFKEHMDLYKSLLN